MISFMSTRPDAFDFPTERSVFPLSGSAGEIAAEARQRLAEAEEILKDRDH